MSHRPNCPSRWEAERQGERAFSYGSPSYSNPYDRWNSRNSCRDAERAWEDGYLLAERRAEEEAASRRAAERRRQEECQRQIEEEAYWARRREEEEREAYYEEQMAAEEAEHWFWVEQDQLLDLAETI